MASDLRLTNVFVSFEAHLVENVNVLNPPEVEFLTKIRCNDLPLEKVLELFSISFNQLSQESEQLKKETWNLRKKDITEINRIESSDSDKKTKNLEKLFFIFKSANPNYPPKISHIVMRAYDLPQELDYKCNWFPFKDRESSFPNWSISLSEALKEVDSKLANLSSKIESDDSIGSVEALIVRPINWELEEDAGSEEALSTSSEQ